MLQERTEHSEASAFTKFKLLMWKNFLQQRRHRVQTAVEILLPVITMSLILILRWQMEPYKDTTRRFPPVQAHLFIFSERALMGMDVTNLSVAYSPRSPVLEDIVKTAYTNLMSKNVPVYMDMFNEIAILINETEQVSGLLEIPLIPGKRPHSIIIPTEIRRLLSKANRTQIYNFILQTIKVQAYDNSSAMRRLYNSEDAVRKVILAVQFDDALLGTTQLPIDVRYYLRFPERLRCNIFYNTGGRTWRTDSVFPFFQEPGPRNPYSWEGGDSPGYVNEMFIGFQNAIALEIISRLTGENLKNYNIEYHRFPHPPFLNDFALDAFARMLPMILIISYAYTAVNIVRSVTLEKELQLKESMKIMGLPTWLHWTAWFCKQIVFLFISSALIVVILKIHWFETKDGFTEYAVVTNTPWSVLLFFIMLYMMTMIFFCFMISGFFSKASTAGLFMGIIWFLNGIPAALLNMENTVSATAQAVTCLLINCALTFGFKLMISKETIGGVQWGEFFSTPTPDSERFLFGHVVIMLVVDSVLYMLIALYLEQVVPGPFGTPKPWNFPFTSAFWWQDKTKTTKMSGVDFAPTDKVLKEADPVGHNIGVQISDLTKVFGSYRAVDHLTLNIFDDQITVLLGHNGAGKTTTISMLTGNLESTRGSVILAGYNIKTQPRLARSHLGLCPQHNVLFNELTVKEHLEFFARLKGFKGKELEEDIKTLIEKLELQEMRDYPSAGLSGGQKRRLCVGIALCGAARVVLLDEPTSGMDPSSRRSLWDLLQKEKKGRSMILTTHFMDEADYLGDRVAIMAQGRLQCVGSPHFLKQHHGVGYTLVVVKDEGFNSEKCVGLINKYIPNTPIKEDRGSEISFHLTSEHSSKFEEMLKDLEKNIKEIKFKNYGLIATTLENVFMKLGADLKPVGSVSDDGTSSDTSSVDSTEQLGPEPEDYSTHRTTKQRLLNHVRAMWTKLFLVWSRSWGILLIQLVVPLILINTTLGVVEYILSFTENVVPRNLTLTKGFADTETLVNFGGTSPTSLGSRATSAYQKLFRESGVSTTGLTVVKNQTMEEYYLQRANAYDMAMSELRHRILIGATFGDNKVTAWFSNFGYHDVAMSLNAVHAALLRASNPAAQLHVYNYPLEISYMQSKDLQEMISLVSVQLASGVGSSISIISAVFVMFYIRERVCGAKLLQQAAGLQPNVMWVSAFIADWCWFLICCISILISCWAFNVYGLSTARELGRLFLCFMIYGFAMLPMVYLLSLKINGPTVGFVVVFFTNLVFGMMCAQIVEALKTAKQKAEAVTNFMDSTLQFFPMYSLVTAVKTLNKVEMVLQSCKRSCAPGPSALISSDYDKCMENWCQLADGEACCSGYSQLQWADPGILRYLFMMLLSGVVFWIALFVLEYRLLDRFFIFTKEPPPVDSTTVDKDVQDEEFHANHIDKPDLAKHGLVTKRLSKYYGKHLAVNQISFSVSDAECFGLLGVNGAGKTSTFKMLMGEGSISSGDAYVSGHSVKTELNQVYKNIGYCPQFDALFPELTGRETLGLFSLLRGLPDDVARRQTDTNARALGFYKHLDKRYKTLNADAEIRMFKTLNWKGRGININGEYISHLRFADDIVIMTETLQDLQQMLNDLADSSVRIGLRMNLDRTKVDQYSGGTKRKLNTAIALMGRSRLVFVDEPTTGVDPAAKRHVWKALRRVQLSGRGVVMTSHSMEECEALCSRLTIMVNGRFQCLGSPQHLKDKFSQGYTLTIKLGQEEGSSMEASTDAVKKYIETNFKNPKLMEEYEGLLTYYLQDTTMPWSKMFGVMERAKQDLHVEYYSITQTTLEQIFLQFTKYQKEGKNS